MGCFENSPINFKVQPSLRITVLVCKNLLSIILKYRFRISRSGAGSVWEEERKWMAWENFTFLIRSRGH